MALDRPFAPSKVTFSAIEQRLLPIMEPVLGEEEIKIDNYDTSENEDSIRLKSESPINKSKDNFDAIEEIFLIEKADDDDDDNDDKGDSLSKSLYEDSNSVHNRKRKRRQPSNFRQQDDTLVELKKIRMSLESVNTNLGLIATTIQRLGDIIQKRVNE